MEKSPETRGTPEMGSGVAAGEQGTAYDRERLGEPGDPGVPTGDQYPTNERDNITEGGYGGVGIEDVPGTRPAGVSLSSEPEPTKDERSTGSLGDLAEDVSTSERARTKDLVSSEDSYSHEDAAQQQATKHGAEESEAK